ncbi:MAG: UDP-N-acetylglucosamine 2-epimerase (non-hydrolyzing) [Elusimicrobia bacterium]|nr:UDP-N-acetylglucosamine 2-epimerase (non-hydrolyzing) [Elusimicrobiota bacterium]
MKVLVVMGTRPEAIKLAPVVAALRRRKGLRTFVCATAQHRELLDQALGLFSLKPDFDLDLMRPGQTPGALAKRAAASLGPLLEGLRPDMVVVQGDTTTAAAAALCAFERNIPVAHVEAGLRSFDLNDPFPEERNRIVIDALSTIIFPPTPAARDNLKKEKLSSRMMFLTGNTVVDALNSVNSAEGGKAPSRLTPHEVLVTLHRREIHGKPLKRIYKALLALVKRHEDLLFVYPVHPTPLILKTAKRMLRHPRIRLLPPQPYREFLSLLKRSLFVITDSGGVQEEAVCLGKPVLVAREKTERPEVLSSGAGRLVGLDPRKLAFWAEKLLENPALLRRMSRVPNPYGDGRAAERVAAGVAHWFGLARKPRDWKPTAPQGSGSWAKFRAGGIW